ncbi:YiiD C-terminal domain-containing protein [Arenimonas fontis]|uniref:Thioesterase n=1 Tax=Arenimonas fontis TaxID=2608255 RepID=A0A5B2Z9X6_9GAMM|nr:YiiD C-terminal domain-containing protein [Arenimonas fontis]KAA2284747.1 thioesterase [Arenimonas fontis]
MDPIETLNAHYRAMPPVAAMQARAVRLEDGVLHLHAPLAANVNDKGCAFGGSLAGLMTLAGWGLLSLELARAGYPHAEVYVADSQLRYLKPLYADLAAEAWLAPESDLAAFLRAFAERGRARAMLQACVRGPDGATVAELSGRFAAFRL